MRIPISPIFAHMKAEDSDIRYDGQQDEAAQRLRFERLQREIDEQISRIEDAGNSDNILTTGGAVRRTCRLCRRLKSWFKTIMTTVMKFRKL
jgi:hypothetical protein